LVFVPLFFSLFALSASCPLRRSSPPRRSAHLFFSRPGTFSLIQSGKIGTWTDLVPFLSPSHRSNRYGPHWASPPPFLSAKTWSSVLQVSLFFLNASGPPSICTTSFHLGNSTRLFSLIQRSTSLRLLMGRCTFGQVVPVILVFLGLPFSLFSKSFFCVIQIFFRSFSPLRPGKFYRLYVCWLV